MDLPTSKYGYWAAPDGEFYCVDDERHLGFARRMLGKRGGGEGARNDDWRVDLLQAGWTRVALHSGVLCIQLPPVPIEPVVLQRLHDLVQRVYYEGLIPLAIEDNLTGAYAGGHSSRRRDPKVARQWVRLARQRGVRLRFRG